MKTIAKYIRIRWMTLMGISMQDIEYHIKNDPPTSVYEELKQYLSILYIETRL
jgi:hypothetical protein